MVQPEDYKLIPLTRGEFAKVDNEDFDRVKDICWSVSNNKYAVNDKVGLMHRFIMNAPSHLGVDHILGDTLDNRKNYLRVATHQENTMNQRPRKGLTSKYKGVSWCRNTNSWTSYINLNKERYRLGRYLIEDEAGRAYDKKALELFGEFACLNFPELKEEYLKIDEDENKNR